MLQFRESEDYEDNADAYNDISEGRDIDTDKYDNDVKKESLLKVILKEKKSALILKQNNDYEWTGSS